MHTEVGKASRVINPQRVRNTSAYRAAMAWAARLLKNPRKLSRLADEALARSKHHNPVSLRGLGDNLRLMLRLARAHAQGRYRALSWSSMVLVVAALVYFVVPVDLVPDFLVAVGFMDDAAILAWTMAHLGDELARFAAWEKTQPAPPEGPGEAVDD